MENIERLKTWLINHQDNLKPVVDFNPASDQLYAFDLTSDNTELTDDILKDTRLFSGWTEQKLKTEGARYGIGGYNEHRSIYNRSSHFDTTDEPRRLHLGVDIWGPAGTAVFNFYEATVHSFKNNNQFGDYGGTIILKYTLDGLVLYALYGHLSLASLDGLENGQTIQAGQLFAEFGNIEENGNWPPHLHFQLMFEMDGKAGDYPGVCQLSKKDIYLQNCPDPGFILRHTFKLP
jgi:murein DD-endopeptidase MepM/ murein hydrolase activator NlpD